MGLSTSVLCFFSAGAFFGINGMSFTFPFRKYYLPLLGCYVASLACASFVDNQVSERICVAIGVIAMISTVAMVIGKKGLTVNKWLGGCSFFVFAYHYDVLKLVIKMSYKIFVPTTDLGVIGLYVFAPTLVVVVGVLLYYIIWKYFPE